MGTIFSPKNKTQIWRSLWIALAKGEKALGLPITDAQIAALEKNVSNIDLEKVATYEKEFRHDVMAHLHAFSDLCPEAKGIIHLGATSTFLTDNTDLIQIRSALNLLKGKLLKLLSIMDNQAKKYASLPTLGYTHFQPAQPTTVGKRICLWMQDFVLDLQDLINQDKEIYFLGVKGATGTQASFMELFDQDSQKVEKLDQLVAQEMGFTKIFSISGQTYTRKQDHRILSILERLGASSHKCGTDLRLLSHTGEMLEGREKKQVGSSAMPHKRNPILSERVCSLGRFLISLCQNGAYTHATQWLERSLDDSANRRILIPEAFLTADSLLNLLIHIFSHLEIVQDKIKENLEKELPHIALENILMHAAKKGKDRQLVHEKLRTHPKQGKEIAKELGFTSQEMDLCFTPQIGRAKEQVTHFLDEWVGPLLKQFKDAEIPLHEITV